MAAKLSQRWQRRIIFLNLQQQVKRKTFRCWWFFKLNLLPVDHNMIFCRKKFQLCEFHSKRRLHLQQMLNLTCNATRYFSNTCCRIVHTRFKKCNCNTQQKTPFRILGMFGYLIKFIGRSTFYTNKRFFCVHYGSPHEKKNIY